MNCEFLSQTKLFQGIRPEDIPAMLNYVGAYEKNCPKGTIIFHSGDNISEMCIVEEGSAVVVTNFYWGSNTILAHINKGRCIAATYAALPDKELNCDVTAAEDCTLLMVDIRKILACCKNNCPFHQQLILNLVQILATKNWELSTRISHIIPHSILERLYSFLSEQYTRNEDPHFTIPFSRQQLADYLCVDRTALSNELSKMQKEGLILFQKNEFTLLSNFQDKT